VVDPVALDILRQHDIPTDGLRSKSWEEYAKPEAPHLHFVFTVCDQAAAEQCPLWPGTPMTARWAVPDPSAVTSSDEARRRAFRDAALVLRRRIELFASLPIESLVGLALQHRLDEIGRAQPPISDPRPG
jgi:protein-tyrosine-phosphatase